MSQIDRVYNQLAETIIFDGFSYSDKTRNNVGLVQIPHYTLEIDVLSEFPLLTTKKVYWKKILVELLWMLSGSTSLDYLHKNNVHIWDKDSENFKCHPFLGDVGRIYGPQWRSWAHPFYQSNPYYLDQIENLVTGLKTSPFNRRHIVTAWNPAELSMMCLPPCHWSFEILPFYDENKNICFVLKWHQRSVDTFLGLPFDIASYAFLGKMLEQTTGYKFTNLIGDLSNVHFYKPHLGVVAKQLKRSIQKSGPKLKIKESKHVLDYKIEDFEIINYKPAAPLKGELFTQTTK